MSVKQIRIILFALFAAGIFASGGTSSAAFAVEPQPTQAPPASGGNGAARAGTEEPSSEKADAEAGSPVVVINQLNLALQNVLQQAEALGYEGRLERLSPILDAAFDFEYMAQKTVGRHWSELSPEQQERWADLFADLTKATYAGRFNQSSGQTFELIGQQPGASETVVVRTKVVSPGEEDVNLSYRLGNTAAGWQIIDVYFKGTVSELAMRRADYSSVLKNEGFGALVERVNERIAELRAEASP